MWAPRQLAIVCDFDGTATTKDLGGETLMQFADPKLREKLTLEYRLGSLTLADFQKRLWGTVRLSRVEFDLFIDSILAFRQRFFEFCQWLDDQQIYLVFASGGFDHYIHHSFGRFGFAPREKILCNQMVFHENDRRIEVEFPYFEIGCENCSHCKGQVVENLRQRFEHIIGIGDGWSDRCMAKVADTVFARSGLVEYCKENGLAYCDFDTFDDVRAGIERMLQAK